MSKQWEDELALAREILRGEPGKVERSDYNYEAFRYAEPGVLLIFYPHRTTARNYHLRVRDGGGKDKPRTNALMRQLDAGAGFNCTFARKGGAA